MFSSDDDEPLAVIASKAKQKGQRANRKGRSRKAEKRKRVESESSAEALENEFDSDEIPLADGNDEGKETKSREDSSVNGGDPLSNEGRSTAEKKTFVDDAVQRPTSNCDGSGAKITHRTQDYEHSLENSEEVHAKDEDDSNSSSSDDSEKRKVLKGKNTKVEEDSNSSSSDDSRKGKVYQEDEQDLENLAKEHVQVDNESHSSSDDSKTNEALEKQKKARKAKRKRETKQRSENESSGKKEMRKQKQQQQDGAAIRLSKLKKMVTLAGLRIVYKKFFEDIADNDCQRVKALEKEMERRGLTPPFTMEACKAFKLQREQEAELAELSKNYIIEIGENQEGRVTRGQRSAALATRRRRGIIFEESSDEDEEDLEEREHMKNETQNMFKNLRGIVSDDADSD